MLKWIKQSITIGSLCVVLSVTTASCGGVASDYHKSKDDKWLIEQVEKGYLTQEQADAIRKQQQELAKPSE